MGTETLTGSILDFCLNNKLNRKIGFIKMNYYPEDIPAQEEFFVITYYDDNNTRIYVRLIPYNSSSFYEYRRQIFADEWLNDWVLHFPYSEWNKPSPLDIGAFPSVTTINGGVDLNELLLAGVYNLEYAEGCQDAFNLPTNAITHISLLIIGIPTRLTQIATLPYSHEWETYIRYKHDSTWSGWKKIETT